MKKKDIAIVAIALAIIIGSSFALLRMLSPEQKENKISAESDGIPTVPSTIDETTYKIVESLSDYGDVELQGIGKSDLFGGL